MVPEPKGYREDAERAVPRAARSPLDANLRTRADSLFRLEEADLEAGLVAELGSVDQAHIGLYYTSIRLSKRHAANTACLRRILEERVGSLVRAYEDAERLLDEPAIRYLSSELNRITSAWRQRLLREASEEARKSNLGSTTGEALRRAIERDVAAAHARASEVVRTEKARHDLRPRSVLTDVLGKDNVTTASAAAPAASPPQGMMSSRELAQLYGLPPEPVRKRLERWRKANHEGWAEAANRERGEPRYLYLAAAVAPILEKMRASAIASAVRPST